MFFDPSDAGGLSPRQLATGIEALSETTLELENEVNA